MAKLTSDMSKWISRLTGNDAVEFAQYLAESLDSDETICYLSEFMEEKHTPLSGQRRWKLFFSFFQEKKLLPGNLLQVTWNYKKFTREPYNDSLSEFKLACWQKWLPQLQVKWLNDTTFSVPLHQEQKLSILLIGTPLLLKDTLQHLGYSVHEVSNGVLALEKIRREKYTHIFVHHPLPVLSGKELEFKIQQIQKAKVIFLSQGNEFLHSLPKIQPDLILKVLQ